MPKHNNPVPNAHFHKQWDMRVKTWFDQAPKAQKRRNNRLEKAKRVFPRPVAGPLRPLVQCPTIRYNSRTRYGRGFTLEELHAAKISKKLAPTIGIAVDHRRRNRTVPTFERNVARLTEYKSKLIIFPRVAGKPKAGDATAEQIKEATQHTGSLLGHLPHFPPRKFETRPITEADQKEKAYYTLRQARANQRWGFQALKRARRNAVVRRKEAGEKKAAPAKAAPAAKKAPAPKK